MATTYDLTNTIPAAKDLVPGDILECPYSGAAISCTLPAGKYNLECWGAQGGKGGYRAVTSGTASKTAYLTTSNIGTYFTA